MHQGNGANSQIGQSFRLAHVLVSVPVLTTADSSFCHALQFASAKNKARWWEDLTIRKDFKSEEVVVTYLNASPVFA